MFRQTIRSIFLYVSAALLSLLTLHLCYNGFEGMVSGEDLKGCPFVRMDYAPPSINVNSEPRPGKVVLSFDGQVKAQLHREVGIPLLYLDILGGKIDLSPLVTPFATGPVRLARLMQLSENPPVIRATFFLRELVQPRIRTRDHAIEMVFGPRQEEEKASQGVPPIAEKTHLIPYPLIAPQADPMPFGKKEGDPVHLDVRGVSGADLLRKLAKQAGVNIHFRDPVDGSVDLSIEAASPIRAIEMVLEFLDGAMTIEQGEIWISKRNNPLLLFSDSDFVEGADLRGLAIGDVLRAMGQMGDLNILLDKSLASLKDKPVDMLVNKMSYRRTFESILAMFELQVRMIDPKTLLVMTQANMFQTVGNIIKVIPVQTNTKKMRELLTASFSKDFQDRIKVQEDLGNIILIGDRAGVEEAQTMIESVESRMKQTGESTMRVIFKPVNTEAKALSGLVAESLGEADKPLMVIDPRTEALVVSGSKRNVERALAVMREIDRPPTKQALIRIKLVEISRQDLKTYGLNVKLDNIAIPDLNRPPTQVLVPAQLNSLESNHKVKTLANPTLRCLDKEKANIVITESIPVKNTVINYVQNGNGPATPVSTDQWNTANIGITMGVTPFIHEDNEITLDVNVDLTELVSFVEGHPWTAARTLKTKVRVKDKETVILGGLIRRKKTENRNPVPYLSRIPLLRNFFKKIESHQNDHDETEMIILITPWIVGHDKAGLAGENNGTDANQG